jgi:hypothetical protein
MLILRFLAISGRCREINWRTAIVLETHYQHSFTILFKAALFSP